MAKPSDIHLHGELEDVDGVIELQPGDAVILAMPADTTQQMAQRVLDIWEERLPDYRVVLIAGADVYVMRNVQELEVEP